jgi:hypothetical protein
MFEMIKIYYKTIQRFCLFCNNSLVVFLLTSSSMCTDLIYAACDGEEKEAGCKIDRRKHIRLCLQI